MLGAAVGCCELVAEVAPWSQSRGRDLMYPYSLQPLPLQMMVWAAPTLQREWVHSRPPNIERAPVTP